MFQTSDLLGCLLSGISDDSAQRQNRPLRSRRHKLRYHFEGQVPPEVAVALLDLIETPSEATWIDGVRGSDEAHLFYGCGCSIGLR